MTPRVPPIVPRDFPRGDAQGVAKDLAAEFTEDVARADAIVVGPAPPLRGGIAAHTARLVEAMRADGMRVAVLSYRRLYPALLFPGRSQRTGASPFEGSAELVDVLSPRTWARARELLGASRATVVLQWWHPVVAPALLAATRGLDRRRVVAVVHNLLPHEGLPGARAAARLVLARAGRVVCHGRGEAGAVRAELGEAADVRTVALPCLLPPRLVVGAAGGIDAPDAAREPGARWAVAGGHVRSYKAIDVLLEAWLAARLPPGARLAVVGESYLGGRERRRVLDLVRSSPSIVLVDRYVDDAELVSWLRVADVLVAAHRRATQSGTVPVAAAMGVPCIVSDAGELAAQAGAGASVVRAGSIEDLARALERAFAANPRPWSHPGDDAATRIADGWRRVIEAIVARRRPSSGVRSGDDG